MLKRLLSVNEMKELKRLSSCNIKLSGLGMSLSREVFGSGDVREGGVQVSVSGE